MKNKLIAIFILVTATTIFSQTGSITGVVLDRSTGEPLPGVNVIIVGTQLGQSTDLEGNFTLENIDPGMYQVKVSYIGYETVVKSDVIVNTARPIYLEFELSPSAIELEGVVVTSQYFEKDPAELANVTALSYEEIRRSPGGFEDVARALSVLPGVAQVSNGRNDLVVRGGAPSENLYLIDGFVVSNINHFGSQGATGGSLSYINLDFVNNTTFSSGGFSAKYGDKVSSTLTIDMRDGRTDRFGGKGTISATQFGLNLEGPISSKGSYLFSIRRSYLDFIFNAAGFNFIPEYYDALGKVTYNISNRDKLKILFVGAYDRVKFNNEDMSDIYDNSRILGSNQNQYVFGASYRHLFGNGFYTISASRNFIEFDSFQNDTLLNPIYKNNSIEAENELKFETVYKVGKSSEFNFGISGKIINFETDIKLNQFVTTFGDTLPITRITAKEDYYKSSAYLQYNTTLFERLNVSAGVRGDYFNAIENKFYVSPRLSLLYQLTPITSLNISAGIYHQFPSYLWLTAYEQNKTLDAIKVYQYIAGIEHFIRDDVRVKIEGFYKDYNNYPASMLRTYLVLANTGGGYGGSPDNFSSLGLEPLSSLGFGKSRGFEFSVQKKSSKIPHYALLSITYSQTDYTAIDGLERNGQYDQRWIANLSGGYIFNENWETSLRFRIATGMPYTPYESDGTQKLENFNSERFPISHSLDLRVDRRWNFDNWALIAYIDIQNIYNQDNQQTIRWDYEKQEVDMESSIGILPSIGVSIEF